MSSSRPYQPLLLRLLHGVNAAITLLAILSAFWVYNTYDGRFGRVPLPQVTDMIGIHGTFGKLLLLGVMPAFALYSFHKGQQRLIQPDSLQKLAHINQPIGWYSLHRLVNTLMLLALAFSLVSGSLMKEEWLPSGELTRLWYSLHLAGWVVLVFCLAAHGLMSAKVGGAPLILSMFDTRYRADDSPARWWQTIRSLFNRV